VITVSDDRRGELVAGKRDRHPPSYPPAVWLNVRFTLCYRDVEDLLAERGGCLLRNSAAMGLEIRTVVRGGGLRATIERVRSLARLNFGELGDDLEAFRLGERGDWCGKH
jgi:hypothetical protein